MNRYLQAFEFFKNVANHVPLKFADDKFCKQYDENLMLIKELVEKATPKKPLDVCTPVVKWGLCSTCKGELNKLGGGRNRVFENQKYCSDCGQALDWSDEDV